MFFPSVPETKEEIARKQAESYYQMRHAGQGAPRQRTGRNMADDSALREIMTGIGNNAAPNRLGQAMSQYSEPAIQQIQQLIQMLFGPKQDPNANMIWDPEMNAPRPKGSRIGPLKQQFMPQAPSKPGDYWGY
jgi:hypothetical protein